MAHGGEEVRLQPVELLELVVGLLQALRSSRPARGSSRSRWPGAWCWRVGAVAAEQHHVEHAARSGAAQPSAGCCARSRRHGCSGPTQPACPSSRARRSRSAARARGRSKQRWGSRFGADADASTLPSLGHARARACRTARRTSGTRRRSEHSRSTSCSSARRLEQSGSGVDARRSEPAAWSLIRLPPLGRRAALELAPQALEHFFGVELKLLVRAGASRSSLRPGQRDQARRRSRARPCRASRRP